MTHRILALTTSAAAALLALAAGPLAAQGDDTAATTEGTDGTVQAETGATDMETGDGEAVAGYAPATLEAFASAAIDLNEVRAEYADRIAAAADRAEAEALVAEAQAALVNVVRDAENITVEEYAEIGNAAQQNPELAERLTMLIQERAEAMGLGTGAGEAGSDQSAE